MLSRPTMINTTRIISTIILTIALMIQVVVVQAQTQVQPRRTVQLFEIIGATKDIPVVSCLDLDAGGELLALGGDDRIVRLIDLKHSKVVKTFSESQAWVRGVALKPDRSQLLFLDQDGQITMWNLQNGQQEFSMRNELQGGHRIVFSPNGKSFAVCGFDKNIIIYDAETGAVQKTLATDDTGNRAIAFSPDSTMLAAGGRSGTVRIWLAGNGRKVADITPSSRRVNAVAFSPDGASIAIAGEDPFITTWNTKTGKQILTLPERPGKTYSLAYCGPNKLASGESDNAVRIWDLTTKTNTATLLGHTGTVATMVFSTERNELVTGSFDTTVRLWVIP